MQSVAAKLKVKDEVWLVVASLSYENPDRDDFSLAEIFEKFLEMGFESRPSSFRAHVGQHTVSNVDGHNPCRYLYQTAPRRRRLFLEGDECVAEATGKILPDLDEIPVKYRFLLEWAETRLGESRLVSAKTSNRWFDALVKLQGSFRYTASGQTVDQYVRELRADWDSDGGV